MREVFRSHYYEWEGCLYKQLKGCHIGLRARGVVARIVMDYWARHMHTLAAKTQDIHAINPVRFERIDLHLLKKYVDDFLVCSGKVRHGVRLCSLQTALV